MTSDLGAVEPPLLIDEGPLSPRLDQAGYHLVLAQDGALDPGSSNRGTMFIRRFAVTIIVFLWITQYAAATLMRHIRLPDEPHNFLIPRALINLFGILLSLAILAVQSESRQASLVSRMLLAAGLAVLGCTLHTIGSFGIFAAWFWEIDWVWADFFAKMVDWLWFYAAISIVILALTYGADLADNEEQIAALRARADSSQLRALRYQLNPHFLFNTLNSIASLISRRKNVEAEAMVISLSDFLRSTLKIDPEIEIELGQEIALQSLYLDIERSRFPHRLRVTIDVPPDLTDALVPNLILQPLVENAIKHGVARSSKQVHLEISASQDSKTLQLEIRDDGGNAQADAGGASVGLRNVSERLKLHFGDAASLDARPRQDGGFAARVSLPLRRAA